MLCQARLGEIIRLGEISGVALVARDHEFEG